MGNATRVVLCLVFAFVLAQNSFGDTVFIDFDSGVGPLSLQIDEATVLTTSGNRASFTGTSVTVLEDSGSPQSSDGFVSVTIHLQPSVDAVNGVGVFMADANDLSKRMTAICNANGDVTLTDATGTPKTVFMLDPSATDNYVTLEWDAGTDIATVISSFSITPPQPHSASRPQASDGATSVVVGVISLGPGGFEDFEATGPGLGAFGPADTDGDGTPDNSDAFPNNPNGATDSDNDGIGDEWELDHFGDLVTADETTDYDGDTILDIEEFENDSNPADGGIGVPTTGILSLIVSILATLIAAYAKIRRA